MEATACCQMMQVSIKPQIVTIDATEATNTPTFPDSVTPLHTKAFVCLFVCLSLQTQFCSFGRRDCPGQCCVFQRRDTDITELRSSHSEL
jgi:hypothetical protein